MTVVEWFLVALVGGGVGFLSGIFGVGGGFLLVPALNILLGIPMTIAVGSTACQILGPATTSLMARRIDRSHLPLPIMIAGGLLMGVAAGSLLLSSIERQGIVFAGLELSVDVVVLGVYFLLMLGLGMFALWEVSREKREKPIPRGCLNRIPMPPYVTVRHLNPPQISLPLLAWFGLLVGLLSGLLGMSGGLVLLPGLVYLLGVSTQQAVISSLVIVWLVSFQATIFHAWNGYVSIPLVCALMIGGTFGARLGSELGQRLKGAKIRQSFGWLLLATALLTGSRLWQLLCE